MDCDLRKSQIAAKYGVRIQEGTGYGTVHYLAGMCGLNDVLYETGIPGAYMVPVGREVSNSLALLSTPRLRQMLKALEERFDFVVVDAPPVGVIIDAAEIAKSCDGHDLRRALQHDQPQGSGQKPKTQIVRAGLPRAGARCSTMWTSRPSAARSITTSPTTPTITPTTTSPPTARRRTVVARPQGSK